METSNGQVEKLKLFVGGLSWETDGDKLKEYFANFGEVTDSVVMIDQNTRKPRGFGFVTFAQEESLRKVLDVQEHLLDSKKIDPKPATAKNSRGGDPSGEQKKKVFVGGLPAESKPEELEEHFSKYGKVKEVDIKKDKSTNRQRGFGFLEFEDAGPVQELIKIRYINFKGKMVEVKEAQPRPSGNAQNTAAHSGYQQGTAYPPQHHQQQQYTPFPTYGNYAPTYTGHEYYNSSGGGGSSAGYPGYSHYYEQQYSTQTNQSYGGSGQQVAAASVPGQQMSSYQNTHSYGSAGGRGATGYSNTSEGYGSTYAYHQDGAAHYDSRNVASYSQQRPFEYSAP